MMLRVGWTHYWRPELPRELCKTPEMLVQRPQHLVAGGFYGSTPSVAKKIYVEWTHLLNDSLQMGLMDNDQFILFNLYCRRPDLFYMHKCVHPSVFKQAINQLGPTFSRGAYHCPVTLFLAGT